MVFRPSKSIPMGSAPGSENVDQVWPTTKRLVWRNACRSLIARPAPAKSLSMNRRIGPRSDSASAGRCSTGWPWASRPCAPLPRPWGRRRDRRRDEPIVGPEGVQRVNGDQWRLPPSFKDDLVPGTRIEPGNSPAVTANAEVRCRIGRVRLDGAVMLAAALRSRLPVRGGGRAGGSSALRVAPRSAAERDQRRPWSSMTRAWRSSAARCSERS